MDYFKDLLSSYKHKGVLVDTNLLLVYFIGMYDPDRILKFKRTAAFTLEDFHILFQFFQFFDRIMTTPNILAEVNSLSNQLAEDLKPSYYPHFGKHLSLLNEEYIPSKAIALSAPFDRFGLTDTGIINLVQGKYLVLTDDLRLATYLQNISVDVINFNHIRVMYWDY